MQIEEHAWYSERLGRLMGLRVYGHYGAPLLVFPTSGGDEREYEGQGMIEALASHLEAGRIKIFTVASVNDESWYNRQASPRQRSYLQAQYDAYVAFEVAPFIRGHCRTPDIPVAASGSSFGAYHAANSLLKHPEIFTRCLALSGIYDVRRYMDGDYDDNCYFNNPVDYAANLSDPRLLDLLERCDLRLVTGTGPWEQADYTYALAEVLERRGIPHRVENWGPQGGHDWPYWKRQMEHYVRELFG